MDTDQFSIPISMLRQYIFCPRIPYFYLVRQITPAEKIWVRQGVDEHSRQCMLNKRRNLSRYGIDSEEWTITHNHELYGEQVSLHGICDAIISTPTEDVILEFKSTENLFNYAGSSVQLCAYALCYEEMSSRTIRRGFILYGKKGKCHEVNFNEILREKVIKTKDEILKMINTGTLPDSPAESNKCSQCEFFNFCSDRF